MDKKNFLIGISLLVLAFVLMFKQSAERELAAAREQNATRQKRVADKSSKEDLGSVKPLGESNESMAATPTLIETKAAPREEIITKALALGKDDPVEIFFTNHGAAIHEIHLKETDRVLKSYEFRYSQVPALALNFEDRDFRPIKLDAYEESAFERIEDGNSSRLTWVNRAGTIEIRREY
ncbi:uncharacterized protein METZ01_LOCUS501613, partial [marine metagenome]